MAALAPIGSEKGQLSGPCWLSPSTCLSGDDVCLPTGATGWAKSIPFPLWQAALSHRGRRTDSASRAQQLPFPTWAGGRTLPTGAKGCPSPVGQVDGLCQRGPAAALPHRGRRTDSASGGQRLPFPTRAGGRTLPAWASGCPSPPGQADGLCQRGPAAALPHWGRRTDSASGGQRLPFPHRGRRTDSASGGQRLPFPTRAGGWTLPAAALSHRGRRTDSASGGQRLPFPTGAGGRTLPAGASGCPSPPGQVDGLGQRRPAAALPHQGRRTDSASGGQRLPFPTGAGGRILPVGANGCPSPPGQADRLCRLSQWLVPPNQPLAPTGGASGANGWFPKPAISSHWWSPSARLGGGSRWPRRSPFRPPRREGSRWPRRRAFRPPPAGGAAAGLAGELPSARSAGGQPLASARRAPPPASGGQPLASAGGAFPPASAGRGSRWPPPAEPFRPPRRGGAAAGLRRRSPSARLGGEGGRWPPPGGAFRPPRRGGGPLASAGGAARPPRRGGQPLASPAEPLPPASAGGAAAGLRRQSPSARLGGGAATGLRPAEPFRPPRRGGAATGLRRRSPSARLGGEGQPLASAGGALPPASAGRDSLRRWSPSAYLGWDGQLLALTSRDCLVSVVKRPRKPLNFKPSISGMEEYTAVDDDQTYNTDHVVLKGSFYEDGIVKGITAVDVHVYGDAEKEIASGMNMEEEDCEEDTV
ncbi:collagen alpha-1(I) chain-like [Macrobrachium rosenbergii]|uniref:collagen alpha-1(I) chain-like n=1 Tax=Macrobrachium rosenbergii TaxID=79674 RepID=UPI0034D39658